LNKENKMYPVDEQKLEAWASDPANRDRARAFGARLIQNQDAAKLVALPSLGEFEDLATLWAARNPMKARLLVMRLATKLM